MSQSRIDSLRDYLMRLCGDTSRYLGRRKGGWRYIFLLVTNARIGINTSGLTLTTLVDDDIGSPLSAYESVETNQWMMHTRIGKQSICFSHGPNKPGNEKRGPNA